MNSILQEGLAPRRGLCFKSGKVKLLKKTYDIVTSFHGEKCEYSDANNDSQNIMQKMFYTSEKYLQNHFSS